VAISTIQPQFSSSILSSKWNTRGWTLQEKHLSKRLLVITNDQAFWHCEAATWYEDTVLETIPPVQVSIDSDTKNVSVPKLDLSVTPIAVYAQLADAYLRRDMKKQSDALSCLQGILNQCKQLLSACIYVILTRSYSSGLATWKNVLQHPGMLYRLLYPVGMAHSPWQH
jgi:hypothetical protein